MKENKVFEKNKFSYIISGSLTKDEENNTNEQEEKIKMMENKLKNIESDKEVEEEEFSSEKVSEKTEENSFYDENELDNIINVFYKPK